jgi:hypothetical protein
MEEWKNDFEQDWLAGEGPARGQTFGVFNRDWSFWLSLG